MTCVEFSPGLYQSILPFLSFLFSPKHFLRDRSAWATLKSNWQFRAEISGTHRLQLVTASSRDFIIIVIIFFFFFFFLQPCDRTNYNRANLMIQFVSCPIIESCYLFRTLPWVGWLVWGQGLYLVPGLAVLAGRRASWLHSDCLIYSTWTGFYISPIVIIDT